METVLKKTENFEENHTKIHRENIMLAVCRILDRPKLHIFSNILCTCSIFIKMWAQI